MPDEELELAEGSAGRPIWSGSISFGLVNVPIVILSAHRPKRVSMRMVTEDGQPVKRRYYTAKTHRELEAEEIVRGYEVRKGKYVPLTDEELEGLAPEQSRNIDVQMFVPADDLDPIYFERAYYMAPAGASTDAYRLLAHALEERERVGIASFVMRSKQYVAAIIAENGILRLETLRRPEEVRSPKEIGLPKPVKPAPADVRRMAMQMKKRFAANISRKEMTDPESERMLALVARKAKKKQDVIRLSGGDAPSEGVIDLVAVLQERLRGAKKGTPTRSASEVRLTTSSKAALLRRARKLGIEGASGMTKPQLIRAIRKAG